MTLLLAALAMRWPAFAQDAGAPPPKDPELTVTAEDPLILLPPLGPPVNEAPLAVPPALARRAAFRAKPAVTDPGFGPPPAPDGVLRIARSVRTVERNSEFTVMAAAVGMDELHEIPGAVSFRNGGRAPMVELGLSGLAPIVSAAPGAVSARAALDSPSWRAGLDGAVTFAGDVRAGQAALSGAAGSLSAALSMQSWQAHGAVAQWRTMLTGQVAVRARPAGPQADLGLASWWSSTGVSAVPAVRLHYAAPPAWHLAAGIRPVLEYPRWLAHLVHDGQGSNLALRPEQGWLAWLGGGIGGVDLRAGWARGLTAGAGDRERAVPVAGADLLLVGAAVETSWQAGAGRPVTVTARAGANWDRATVRWRLRADGEWQISAAPSITLLLGGRWIEFREYHAVYPDEDWTLEMFRDEPGKAVTAGVRWSPVWGHSVELVGGVNFLPEGDLTWGVGIEYARDVVRLTAPP